jgi:hypothetical protein
VLATVLETSILTLGSVLVAVITVGTPLLLNSLRKTRNSNTSDHQRVVDSLTLLASEQQATRAELGAKIDKVTGDLSAHLGWHSAQPQPSQTNVTVQVPPSTTVAPTPAPTVGD